MRKLSVQTEEDETLEFVEIDDDTFICRHDDYLILLKMNDSELWNWTVYDAGDTGANDTREDAVADALDTIDITVSASKDEDVDDDEDEELGDPEDE